MRSITVELKERPDGRRIFIQFRQDMGSMWTAWSESWLNGQIIRLSDPMKISDIVNTVKHLDREKHIVKYELI